MYCSNCGNELDANSVFCSACGTQINEKKESVPYQRTTHDTPVHYNPKKGKKIYIVFGWLFFAISLLFIPILFGAGTVIMGYLVRKENNETHGVVLMVMGVAGAILGSLLGMAVAG